MERLAEKHGMTAREIADALVSVREVSSLVGEGSAFRELAGALMVLRTLVRDIGPPDRVGAEITTTLASAVELRELVQVHGMTIPDVVEVLRSLPPRPESRLTGAERDLLLRLGVDPTEESDRPRLLGMLHRSQLEADSLTVSEAAELIDRDPSRIRQRLTDPGRSLLGFRRRSGQREWLLPRFQFDLGLHDLKAWAVLLQALPAADDTSPVALVQWLSSVKAHLGGRSRAQALAEGYDVDALVAEAPSFGMPA
jgi:hypothetical protein